MTWCFICGRDISPADHVCRQVTGWERKSQAASRRSGSDVLLREPTGRVAHLYCVNLAKSKIAAGQGALL